MLESASRFFAARAVLVPAHVPSTASPRAPRRPKGNQAHHVYRPSTLDPVPRAAQVDEPRKGEELCHAMKQLARRMMLPVLITSIECQEGIPPASFA